MHRRFDSDVVTYTAADLGLGLTPEQVLASPFVVTERVPHIGPGSQQPYSLRSVLRSALYERLRTDRTNTFRQAHRIAATYYHQPLEPLRTDRLTWYVHEVRHLAAFREELATERLATFAHDSLVAGHAEVAGRAAAAVASTAVSSAAQSLAGIIQAVAKILNDPAHVERATVVTLDDLLARHGTPSDPASVRLVLLARDLVVHCTERPAPVTPLTALVVPDAASAVDPRGMPVLGGELRLLEDLTQPSRIITTRTHRVELTSRTAVLHQVTTKLATEDRPGRNMVLADLLPADTWDRLDSIEVSERGVRTAHVLRATETARVVAHGVGRLLGPGDRSTGDGARAELSRRLGALGWYSETEELTALLRRSRQAEGVEDFLRERIAGLMRYTPLVVLLDVYPGLPSEVVYGYQENCTTRRIGWGGVVVSVDLTVPSVVRNRLEFVTPDGLVPVEVEETEDARLVPVRNGQVSPSVQRFDLRGIRRAEDDESDSTARIEVDLGYRLPDREFKGVLNTACLCMALSSLALLLLFANIALLSVVGTVIASVGVLADISRDGSHHAEDEPLHIYAGKRLRVLRQSNAAAAIAAAAVPNAGSLTGSLVASGVAFLYCLATCFIVLSVRRTALRPLPTMTRPGHRTLSD
ncbi:hypothetical protein [Streptomyces sp. CRN 30]|uniref:hypothetical protein n=1 Tax=Streptomyces sp. CRN 30 TaxID=3075613 RepID=UPI002A81FC87|nr:hypothetical protein [Streptomyces sp. CRN 30]